MPAAAPIRRGRPRKYTSAQRRERAAAYQKKWREQNPDAWEKIWKRALAKRRGGNVGGEILRNDLAV